VPRDLDIHIVKDNYATHKTSAIRNFFLKRHRWHIHFTPTAASWLDQVERFFANLTEKQARRGVHRSTAELEVAITACIDAVNTDPKPFRWTIGRRYPRHHQTLLPGNAANRRCGGTNQRRAEWACGQGYASGQPPG
jgi:hypothetical protein